MRLGATYVFSLGDGVVVPEPPHDGADVGRYSASQPFDSLTKAHDMNMSGA